MVHKYYFTWAMNDFDKCINGAEMFPLEYNSLDMMIYLKKKSTFIRIYVGWFWYACCVTKFVSFEDKYSQISLFCLVNVHKLLILKIYWVSVMLYRYTYRIVHVFRYRAIHLNTVGMLLWMVSLLDSQIMPAFWLNFYCLLDSLVV